MIREGSWWTHCPSDPRFDMEGRGMVSAFGCKELDRAILDKAKELGIPEGEIPTDIEIGGMKD